jgi:lauroyl/myristoyl acyltransferase
VSGALQQLRRAATQLAIRAAIYATAALPARLQQSGVRHLIGLAGHMPVLRRKVRERMHLALGDDIPAGAERRYFEHVAWFLSSSLATFQRGLAATQVVDQVKLDPTISVLDDAFAEGRGVVLVVPHWSGHEIIGAVLARRHPMVMLVRQAPTPERSARKAKWYEALGVETVLRPRQSSAIKDAVAYLKVLKTGKMLAITPDLLADATQGFEVTIFGRRTRMPGGTFALAIAAGAPMVRVSGYWQAGSDPIITLTFERAPPYRRDGDRDTVIQSCVQDWCRWFERELRTKPENWLFWLDKRWSRLLRATPRLAGAD